MSRDSIFKASNDSGVEVPTTCPKCYPDICADPEYQYVVVWCNAHAPDLRGTADAEAKLSIGAGVPSTGNGVEAGGDGNRSICDLIHGRSRIATGG